MSPQESEAMIYIQGLTERVNKHSKDLADGLDKIYFKLETIKDAQSQDKLDIYNALNEVKTIAMQDNHKLSVKVALLTGVIGVVSGGAGSFIMTMLKAFGR